MAMTLNEFTRSMDPRSLPRVLQIQSGIYVQGSVYELHGRECCLSNGELIKVIDISITRFIAKGANDLRVDLALDYPGLFKIVADKQPYFSVREIADSVHVSSHRLGQPVFYTSTELKSAEGTIKAGENFRITGLEAEKEPGHLHCELTKKEARHGFTLSLALEGQFYECEDNQFYTLKELAECKIFKGRERTVTRAKSLPKREDVLHDPLENYSGELSLTPVHEIQAVMKYRKEVVLIPPNLDVEVVDVTEHHDAASFVQPLTLRDVFAKPAELFPVVADVIEMPFHVHEELDLLCRSKKIVIHRAYEAKRMLASEMCRDAQRHFLIPMSYNGRFKRRPREFPTAYDLKMARSNSEQLHVVATRAFESHYDNLCSVVIGDQYLIKKSKSTNEHKGGDDHVSESLACMKIEGKNYESVLIPMFIEGGFVEVLHDKKQYTITDVCQTFPLPFNVKVSVRDLTLKEDVLAGASGLQIEEEITDPCLLISTPDLSKCCEVPVNRTHMTVQLLQNWQNPGICSEASGHSLVEEIGEDIYYTLRRYAQATLRPPPRPPKKPREPPKSSAKPKPPRHKKPNSSTCPESPHVTSPKEPSLVLSTTQQNKNSPASGNERSVSPFSLPNPEQQKVDSKEDYPKAVAEDEDNVDDDIHEYEYIDEDELNLIREKFL
ncbi:protein THEMIS isoform X2 [Denticeps clupeoides]|uniref:protein THEMIS isoform X2 n=1 Tax=Denticeps clupeoides TaxID=299321 RepID=UPI0010A3944A|nr:protein THEMIS isoform X2 [Denticeps clupeoides]